MKHRRESIALRAELHKSRLSLQYVEKLLAPSSNPKSRPDKLQLLLHSPLFRITPSEPMSLPLKQDELTLPTRSLDLVQHGRSLLLWYDAVDRAL